MKLRLVKRFVLVALAAAILPQAGGCGRSTRGAVPVSGRVTFGGAPPEKPCVLFFVPEPAADGSTPPQRAGTAETRPDGSFQASSFQSGDGLLPGTYAVGLECWKVPGRHDVPGVSLVPEGFKPPTLVVPQDARSVTYSVDVK